MNMSTSVSRSLSVALALGAAMSLVLIGCGTAEKKNDPSKPAKEIKPSITKLVTEDIQPGTGNIVAEAGDKLYMLYIGTLNDGTVFDGNMDAKYEADTTKDPFTFILGSGGVIKGWDQGLVGAKVGTVRRLKIPYTLGYGEQGQEPKIPGKADLYFDVKVLGILKAKGTNDVVDVKDLVKGTGTTVTENSTVSMKYTGRLLNGKVFDDQSKKAVQAKVSRLVPGFKDAVIGMKKGGKAKITMPPGMGATTGKIPFDQINIFEVEITDVK